jgi:uncharacterized protein
MPTTLITGVSSGIGLELARICAEAWHDLVVVARRWEILIALAQEYISIKMRVIEKDISLPLAPREIYDQITREGIVVDILVNNAGFGDYGLFHEIDIEKEKNMIDLNVRSLTELTYLFGRDMVARKNGKILNVASTAAFQPWPFMSVYFATKHYVLAFSEGIAEEWRDFWVSVTALCPGPTESEFQKVASATMNPLFAKKLPTSHEVALYGYQAMMRGQRVAIHGFMNRFLAFTVRFTPRIVIVKIIRMMQGNKS